MADEKTKKDQKPKFAAPVQEKAVEYFTVESWKGVKDVFKCATCGTCRDDRDAMVEHVLLHFPAARQEEIFNRLVKE